MTLAWFFQTPRRLYGSLAVAGTVGLVLALTVIGVRVAAIPAPAPQPSGAAATAPYGNVAPGDLKYISPTPRSAAAPTEQRRRTAQQIAVEAVEAQGRTAGLTTIQAQDGGLLVLEVLVKDGACTVTVIQDAQSMLVDEVTCT